MSLPRICVVGPLPPPAGGMGNQCAQLLRLLRADGLQVELVQTNPPHRPAWVGRLPLLRAGVRLLPYLVRLWRALGRADVAHVLANSGWAWHLFAAPALLLARLRGVAVVLHYHGGCAEDFLRQAPSHVHALLAGVALRVVPSVYLQRVFARHGLVCEIIPNTVDLQLFRPASAVPPQAGPHLVVSRNLEPVYDNATAIAAFARIRQQLPAARLTLAGSGPELARLQALVQHLGLQDSVHFAGRLSSEDMAALLASAQCLLNPSRVDNMPVSILEAFATGVPVVSTDAGGIPAMLRHGHTGLLVPVGDGAAMAAAALRVLQEPALAYSLRQAGLREADKYQWPRMRGLWLGAYLRATAQRPLRRTAAPAAGCTPPP